MLSGYKIISLAFLGFRKASSFEEVGMKFGRWLGVTDYQLIL